MTTSPPFYTAPRVTVVARPLFLMPEHLPVEWGPGDASDGARLAEYAGRLCYMSQHNPAQRTTQAYLDNILAQGHGSVLEHATYSLLVEQVSRSLTHELVRHRAGFAYSQLSQRYVDSSTVGFVVPPAMLDLPDQRAQFEDACYQALARYEELVRGFEGAFATLGPTEARKRAREAAREVLPNATETKVVVTANVRSWRHFIALRGGEGASREMQRLARAILATLTPCAPEVFRDFTDTCSTPYPKV